MRILEKYRDISTLDSGYYFVHCISSDLIIDSDIFQKFNDEYDLKNKILQLNCEIKYPSCILTDNIFSLVVRKTHKSGTRYTDIEKALEKLSNRVLGTPIDKLAYSKYGSGLDGLCWHFVKGTFSNGLKNAHLDVMVICTRPIVTFGQGFGPLHEYSREDEFCYGPDRD